jgi:DNA-binding HxlR family transcriptional regulator
MEEVSHALPGTLEDTDAELQGKELRRQLKKLFGHLDPANPPSRCPIRDLYSTASDQWSILILIFLGIQSPLRFNQLKRQIYGVSGKTLTDRLRNLEQHGYITRKVHTAVPVEVYYRISPLGHGYLSQLLGMFQWLVSHLESQPTTSERV